MGPGIMYINIVVNLAFYNFYLRGQTQTHILGEDGGEPGVEDDRPEAGRVQRGGHHQRVPRRLHDVHEKKDRRPQTIRN